MLARPPRAAPLVIGTIGPAPVLDSLYSQQMARLRTRLRRRLAELLLRTRLIELPAPPAPPQPKNKPSGPVTDAELVQIITASGFPLEFRLFHKLTDEGMDPIYGHRFSVGDETKEVDLLASVGEFVTQNERIIDIRLSSLMAAKKLHAPACVVGFLGEQPTTSEYRLGRVRIAGLPSFNIGFGGGSTPPYVSEPGGFAEAIDPMCDVPVCVQWGSVTEKSNRRELDHPAPIFEDFEILVSASINLERELTEVMLSSDSGYRQVIYVPVLILDTPDLILYDVKQNQLSRVGWFVLKLNLEFEGRMVSRYIDVITETHFPKYIEKLKEAHARLRTVIGREFSNIVMLGYAERKASGIGSAKR